MDENPLKILRGLLIGAFGAVMLYYGIAINNEIPALDDLKKVEGTFISSQEETKIDDNFSMTITNKIVFETSNHQTDTIEVEKNSASAQLDASLADAKQISFWLNEKKNNSVEQVSVNGKVVLFYDPGRGVAYMLMVFGIILLVLLIFLVRELVRGS